MSIQFLLVVEKNKKKCGNLGLEKRLMNRSHVKIVGEMKSNISVHVPAVGCFVAANLAYQMVRVHK